MECANQESGLRTHDADVQLAGRFHARIYPPLRFATIPAI
jgi:hypothetical protein